MRRAAVAAWVVLLLVSSCAPGGSRAEPGRVIRFLTEDGVSLAGEIRGSGTRGVILAHMLGRDRRSWAEFATTLADDGYRTLAFDFRGFGDSPAGRDIPLIWRDVGAAATALRDRGVRSVVVIGASMGGTAALVAASQGVTLDGVVTLSAPGEFLGLSATTDTVEAVDEPKLFIAGQGDGTAADRAMEFYEAGPPPKRVEIVTSGEHGIGLLQGSEGEEVRALIFGFLERYG